jgi:hypothetical protein
VKDGFISVVMAGLVPAIHAVTPRMALFSFRFTLSQLKSLSDGSQGISDRRRRRNAWMAGTAMTVGPLVGACAAIRPGYMKIVRFGRHSND